MDVDGDDGHSVGLKMWKKKKEFQQWNLKWENNEFQQWVGKIVKRERERERERVKQINTYRKWLFTINSSLPNIVTFKREKKLSTSRWKRVNNWRRRRPSRAIFCFVLFFYSGLLVFVFSKSKREREREREREKSSFVLKVRQLW